MSLAMAATGGRYHPDTSGANGLTHMRVALRTLIGL